MFNDEILEQAKTAYLEAGGGDKGFHAAKDTIIELEMEDAYGEPDDYDIGITAGNAIRTVRYHKYEWENELPPIKPPRCPVTDSVEQENDVDLDDGVYYVNISYPEGFFHQEEDGTWEPCVFDDDCTYFSLEWGGLDALRIEDKTDVRGMDEKDIIAYQNRKLKELWKVATGGGFFTREGRLGAGDDRRNSERMTARSMRY